MSNEQIDGIASGMPVLQTNAHLGDSLVVRAGIPHRGGKLALHAFNEGYAAMVSANAFWNPVRQAFHIPEATDLKAKLASDPVPGLRQDIDDLTRRLDQSLDREVALLHELYDRRAEVKQLAEENRLLKMGRLVPVQ